jgi:hypothetical protein
MLMYDFVKLTNIEPGYAEHLLRIPALEFYEMTNVETGEIMDGVFEAKYCGLEFFVYPSGRVKIQGSLHKFWNDGVHNYNEFTLQDVISTIRRLEYLFELDSHSTRVANLEFGLNIDTPFAPNELLNNLIIYKNIPFSPMKTKGRGKGKEAPLSQYCIKIYNKGAQYNQIENILRFEKKVTKMTNITKGNVLLLSDLMNKDFAEERFKELISCFEDVLIDEKIEETRLTKVERSTYNKGSNPLFWGKATRKQRFVARSIFNSIIERLGPQQFKAITLKLLEEKGLKLINC